MKFHDCHHASEHYNDFYKQQQCENYEIINLFLQIKFYLLRLIYLNELHLQGNQLRLLPPELTGMEELVGNNGVLLMAENPWILPIKEQVNIGTGVNMVLEFP